MEIYGVLVAAQDGGPAPCEASRVTLRAGFFFFFGLNILGQHEGAGHSRRHGGKARLVLVVK